VQPQIRKPVNRQTPRAPKPVNASAFKRNRSRSRSATFTAVIVILAALTYIIQSAYVFLTKEQIATELVRMGSVELPHTLSGIIIRDEAVYTAARDGQVVYSVNDYDRVKAGTVVANIRNAEVVADLYNAIEDSENTIMEYQSSRQDISTVDPMVQRLNMQLKNMIDDKSHSFTMQNLSDIYRLRDDVIKNVNIRVQLITSDNMNVNEAYSLQLQQNLSRLNENLHAVTAAQSGLVSALIDGFEEVYTPENMKDLTREQTLQNVDYNGLLPKKEVVTGDAMFKIVASNDWYVAVYLPNNLIEGYEVGDKRILYLELDGEYRPVTFTLDFINPGFNDTFVVFRNTKNIIDYLNMRSVRLRTSDSVHSGFKISNTAITTRTYFTVPPDYLRYTNDGSTYLLTEGVEGVIQTPVSVSDEDAAFAYIPADTPALAAGVKISTPTLPIYVIPEPVDALGVYKVNNGIAEFERITLDGEEPPELGYVILDPALNPDIKTYDYIVTNAADISEGQIIP
jgi:regulator of sigma D